MGSLMEHVQPESLHTSSTLLLMNVAAVLIATKNERF